MKIKTFLLLISIFISASLTFAQEELEKEERVVPPPPPKHYTLEKNIEKKYFDKLNSELKVKLEKIKEYNEKKYQYLLQRAYFRSMEDALLRGKKSGNYERSQQILNLNISTEALVADYQKASNSEKKEIKQKLKNELSKLFDLREEERKYEVKELERELKELKKSLKIRSQNKNEIIDRRVMDLLGEDKYLDWN